MNNYGLVAMVASAARTRSVVLVHDSWMAYVALSAITLSTSVLGAPAP
jgi:hypothetical protein